MRLLTLLLLLPFLAFAQDIDVCDAQEEQCQKVCCESSGGVFLVTAEQYGCDKLSGQAAVDAYDQCSYQCSANMVSCMSPGSDCGQKYTSCANACVSQGYSLMECDDRCMNEAADCVSNYSGGGSCCGPSFLLGLLALGALRARL